MKKLFRKALVWWGWRFYNYNPTRYILATFCFTLIVMLILWGLLTYSALPEAAVMVFMCVISMVLWGSGIFYSHYERNWRVAIAAAKKEILGDHPSELGSEKYMNLRGLIAKTSTSKSPPDELIELIKLAKLKNELTEQNRACKSQFSRLEMEYDQRLTHLKRIEENIDKILSGKEG